MKRLNVGFLIDTERPLARFCMGVGESLDEDKMMVVDSLSFVAA